MARKFFYFYFVCFLFLFQTGNSFSESLETQNKFPKIPSGDGFLSLSIISKREGFSKRLYIIPDRAEIWLDNRRIAAKNIGEPGTKREKHMASFFFQKINMPDGYHFISIRLYFENPLTNRRQWQGQTFQIGIHPGKVTSIHKNIQVGL